jgi:hypothetical protein
VKRRSLLVIHNPTAGRRRRKLGRVLDALTRDGIKVELAPTAHAGHATEIARDCNGFDAVVAAGGDGTINEVANGIDGRPLGLIPLGTARPSPNCWPAARAARCGRDGSATADSCRWPAPASTPASSPASTSD